MVSRCKPLVLTAVCLVMSHKPLYTLPPPPSWPFAPGSFATPPPSSVPTEQIDAKILIEGRLHATRPGSSDATFAFVSLLTPFR